jgi:hypothetical protein
MCLQELARYHALTFYLIKYEGEKFFAGDESLGLLVDSIWTQYGWEILVQVGGAYEAALEIVRKRNPSLADRLEAKVGNGISAARIWKEMGLKTGVEYFPVITCGDFWVNNIMVKYGDAGSPEKATQVKFLDFQNSRRSCIYDELSYFFLTSTTPETRKANLQNWIIIYYDSFASTLKSVGSTMPQNFTRGNFTDELWKSLLPGFIFNTLAIPFQLGNHESTSSGEENLSNRDSGKPMSVEFRVERQIAKFKNWTETSPRAITRLLDITAEFVELGLL